jgi:hypothetical protein
VDEVFSKCSLGHTNKAMVFVLMCDDVLTGGTKFHSYLYLFGTARCHVLLQRAAVSQLLFCQTANDATCSLKTDSLYEHTMTIC